MAKRKPRKLLLKSILKLPRKPCPFCGCEQTDFERIPYDPEEGEFVVRCGKCHVSGPSGTTHQETLDAWNTRATITWTVADKTLEVAKLGQKPMGTKPQMVVFPLDIYVLARDYGHDGWGQPYVACTDETHARNVAKHLRKVEEADYEIEKIQLVSIPEQWDEWPTNPAGVRKRALAKLTADERKALGL